MAHIHWYPGHIAKAERKLKEQLKLVDVVIEVRDARLPMSSAYPNIKNLIGDIPRIIVLNKSDLVEKQGLILWKEHISHTQNVPVITTSPTETSVNNKIVSLVLQLSRPKIEQLMKKGLLERPARVMVAGMPNVGKSSIINRLIKKSKTKTGAKAGVTRQQQWVRIHPKIDLLDTPGIIPLKLDDQKSATRLAYVNSIGENAFDNIEIANELLKELDLIDKNELRKRYNLLNDEELNTYNIAIAKKWLIKSSEPDETRTAGYILSDFREGRLGKFILDEFENGTV